MTTVVCAGVAVLDIVMYVDAMPQQAQKYRARDAAMSGGGNAANAAVAIARLGGNAALAARIGEDDIGDMILARLAREGVDTALVRQFDANRSSFSSIFVDAEGERLIMNYRDTALDTDGTWLADAALPAFDAALADTRWPQGAEALLNAARKRGKPAVLDAEAPFDHAADALVAATHLAFSMQGLAAYAETSDIVQGLRKAAALADAFVCVTRGADGVSWLQDGEVRTLPAMPVDAVDTLAAGDVWHGAFALALSEGRDEVSAMRFANAAAALKCTRTGGSSGAPLRHEVDALLARHQQAHVL